jgi:uncharacterized protein
MNLKLFVERHPATCYFILTFSISWLGALGLIANKLFHGQSIPKMDGILMFPIMLLGPTGASLILTRQTEGKAGLRNLGSSMSRWKLPLKWYLISFLIPPCLILLTLFTLKTFISLAFSPNLFYFGLLFGIPAGIFEEIGWMGYAFPKIRLRHNFISSGLILGFFWGLWHLPVIDFLGAASPHGRFLVPFFLAFIAIQMAIRLIIAWIYERTNSILLAQFMHAVSTGCLATFGPGGLTPAQETLWYALYAALLWVMVLTIHLTRGRGRSSRI